MSTRQNKRDGIAGSAGAIIVHCGLGYLSPCCSSISITALVAYVQLPLTVLQPLRQRIHKIPRSRCDWTAARLHKHEDEFKGCANVHLEVTSSAVSSTFAVCLLPHSCGEESDFVWCRLRYDCRFRDIRFNEQSDCRFGTEPLTIG